MRILKSLIMVTLVIAASSNAFAQKKADPVGTWSFYADEAPSKTSCHPERGPAATEGIENHTPNPAFSTSAVRPADRDVLCIEDLIVAHTPLQIVLMIMNGLPEALSISRRRLRNPRPRFPAFTTYPPRTTSLHHRLNETRRKRRKMSRGKRHSGNRP